jgi:apolipoprotein N-acyltransferase
MEPEEELSKPIVLGPVPSEINPRESAEGSLSAPIDFPAGLAPPEIARPDQVVTHLDRSRFQFAMCSVALLAFVVVATFVTIWLGRSIDNLTRVLEIIFAPLVAVVAAAVAFYYRGSSL